MEMAGAVTLTLSVVQSSEPLELCSFKDMTHQVKRAIITDHRGNGIRRSYDTAYPDIPLSDVIRPTACFQFRGHENDIIMTHRTPRMACDTISWSTEGSLSLGCL